MIENPHTPCIMTNTDQFFVKVCSCGVVHLCFGPTTLNLSPQTAIAVAETLNDITSELRSRFMPTETECKVKSQTSPANVIHAKFPIRP